MSGLLPEKSITNRHGEKKTQKSIEDILKLLLDPSNHLPTFVAGDLTRLTPVGVEHVDVSALLQEVALLRSEVRNFTLMFNELKNMRSDMDHLIASDIERNQRDHHQLLSNTTHDHEVFPSLPTSSKADIIISWQKATTQQCFLCHCEKWNNSASKATNQTKHWPNKTCCWRFCHESEAQVDFGDETCGYCQSGEFDGWGN